MKKERIYLDLLEHCLNKVFLIILKSINILMIYLIHHVFRLHILYINSFYNIFFNIKDNEKLDFNLIY